MNRTDVIYLGVDMAKTSFVAACQKDDQSQLMGEFANRASGFKKLADTVSEMGAAIHLVVEPTAAYHLSLVAYAHEQNWQVSLPNPKLVADWAKGTGRRAKTDKVDARMLAAYGAERQPHPQQPLPEGAEQLQQLLRRQQDLEQMMQQEKNRQENPTLSDAVTQSLARMRQALEEEQAAVEQAIREHLDAHPELKQQRNLLLNVPGIGQRNVLFILVMLYRWHAHTSGQGTTKGLTAYVGLDPVHQESGSSLHKPSRISKMGNSDIRRRLFLSALGGTRAKHTPLTVFYRRLLSRNKPKMVALIACARKILVWAWAVFQSGLPFDQDKALPKQDCLLT